MAELLVQWVSPAEINYLAEPDLRRRGDVRHVGPNGHTWGRNEDMRKWIADGNDVGDFPGSYRIIQIGGISAPNLRKMIRQWRRSAVDGDPEFNAPDLGDRFIREHQWAWRINIRELPQPKANEARDTGFTTITKAQFITAAVHKGLSLSFDDTDPDGHGAPRLPGTVD